MQKTFEICGLLARIRHCQVRLKSAIGESRQFLEVLLKESEELLQEVDRREAELRSRRSGGPGKVVM